jgi:hypothetical protein
LGINEIERDIEVKFGMNFRIHSVADRSDVITRDGFLSPMISPAKLLPHLSNPGLTPLVYQVLKRLKSAPFGGSLTFFPSSEFSTCGRSYRQILTLL